MFKLLSYLKFKPIVKLTIGQRRNFDWDEGNPGPNLLARSCPSNIKVGYFIFYFTFKLLSIIYLEQLSALKDFF